MHWHQLLALKRQQQQQQQSLFKTCKLQITTMAGPRIAKPNLGGPVKQDLITNNHIRIYKL